MPATQTGSVAPKIDASTTSTLSQIGVSGPFTIYSGTVTKSLSAKQVYGMSIDVAAPGSSGAGVVFYKLFNKDA